MADSGESRASLLGARLGNYVVRALVGRGAMGAVYLARDRSLSRPVALKVLLGSLARNPDQVRRFLREAKAAAPLVHPNIVRIYDAGVRDGVPYIAMEYVEGEPLDRFLARVGALDWRHALHIAQQVAQALACAHAAGVVHRDVKPANILLDAHGRVRLTDFGIARVLDRQGSGFTTHECLGTPEYMSPELCAGEKVGPPADLFSLGVTLFYMLAGHMPFHGDSHVALVQSITNEEAPRLNRIKTGVPDDVARLAAHLLEKDPTARPESAAAVAAHFERLQRENGGASALPEALRAFVQEEARPRQVKSDTPVPGKSRRGPKIKGPAKRRRYSTISGGAQVAVAAMILAAAAGTIYWHSVLPAPLPPEAPVIPMMTARAGDERALNFSLPAAHWRVGKLAWTPDRPVLVTEVEGHAGSAAQGKRGLLSFDPLTGVTRSLSPPGAPVPGALRFARGGIFAVDVQQGSTQPITLLAQHGGEAHPRNGVLARFDAAAWQAPVSSPWGAPSGGTAVLSPAGDFVCGMLYDPIAKGNYLVEIGLDQGRAAAAPRRLTSSGGAIHAESLRYTPDARHIAYLREKGGDERELWIVASGGNDYNGQPIAIGHLDDSLAFSPDARHAVVCLNPDTAPELILVRTDSGDIAARLGAGRVDDQAFHPSGSYLIVQASDDDTRAMQLWALESEAPFRRQRVSSFPGGVTQGGAVSPDGRWVAAATGDGKGGRVELIDLTRLLFAA